MVTYFTKAQAELRAFQALAPLAGLGVVPGTIQQLKPPAPDITCQLDGIGAYNVELVALDDDTTRTRLSNMYNTDAGLQRARESGQLT
jgi:hypothetical protein